MNFLIKFYQNFHNIRLEKESKKMHIKESHAKVFQEKIICLIHKK
jgi:DNA topoisomerase IB